MLVLLLFAVGEGAAGMTDGVDTMASQLVASTPVAQRQRRQGGHGRGHIGDDDDSDDGVDDRQQLAIVERWSMSITLSLCCCGLVSWSGLCHFAQ